MAQLSSKIRAYVGRDVNFESEVRLQDDGEGPYIKQWNLVNTQPSLEELEAYEDEANAAENLVSIDDARRKAYGPIGDQLDQMYWDQVNGTTTWKDHIAQVKADNPK